jgi:hypothetical protein
MAEVNYLELLFLRRHLVKYLQCNLDQEKRVHLPFWEDITHDIAELLPRPELVSLDTSTRAGALRIALKPPSYADIPRENHDKITALLEECFREEFFFFVKQQHTLLRATLDDSIRCFLGQYGICEDDLSLEDLKRNWRRMATRRGKPPERPGRPMKPYAMLKWPRTRDRLRRIMPGWPEAKRPRAKKPARTHTAPKPVRTPPNQLSFFPPAR